jgi:Leucine-rich repeat (LRR) protein
LEIINTSFCDSEQRLPAEIIRLASSLTELEISDTKIIELPNNIGKLKLLEKLILSDAGLKSLPKSIGALSSLMTLILDHNSLSSLPKTMINLRSLHQLTLTNNPKLYSIESLNGHRNLTYLDTRQSPIQFLPKNLPKLVHLDMSDNNLTDLYNIESLGNESNVSKVFYFVGNNIETITPRFSDVRNLSGLNLARNQLEVLPTAIFNIPTLHKLNIKSNYVPYSDIQKYISKFRETNPKLEFLHDYSKF